MTMPFEGYDKFHEKISDDIDNAANKQIATKILEKCLVKPGTKKQWNESVAEAELAMQLNRQERVQTLTFNYAVTGSESKSKKIVSTPKPSAATQPTNNNTATPKPSKSAKKNENRRNSSGKKSKGSVKRETISEDVYEFFEDSDGPEAEATPGPLSFRSRPVQGDFQVYLRKHFDEALKKSPGRSKSEINAFLKEQWDGLPEKDRQIYTERKAILFDDSAMFVAKRSNFDDDYSNDSNYDYDGSDEDKESPGEEDSANLIISRASTSKTKTKRSTSLKSQKLFDKIKNAADTNGIDSGEGTSSTNNLKRKRNRSSTSKSSTPSLNAKKLAPATLSANSSEKVVSKLASRTISQESESSEKNEIIEKSAKKSVGIKRKLCFTDSYGEDTNSSEDASSENSEQIESKRKVKQLDDRFCYKCSVDETPEVGLITCRGICQRMYHKGCIDETNELDEEANSFTCEECTTSKLFIC